jgi:hypothetical protein
MSFHGCPVFGSQLFATELLHGQLAMNVCGAQPRLKLLEGRKGVGVIVHASEPDGFARLGLRAGSA